MKDPLEHIKSCEPFIVELRERFDKARNKGQVELHMTMGDVALLLTLAEGVIRAVNAPPRAPAV